jgi:hypothetical protein
MGTSISKGRSFSRDEIRKTKFLIMKPPGSAQLFDRDGDIICFKRLETRRYDMKPSGSFGFFQKAFFVAMPEAYGDCRPP